MEFSEPRKCPRGPKFLQMPDNTAAYRSRLSTKLQDVFMSDNPTLSYADIDHQITRNADNFLPKSSGIQQGCAVEGKAKEDELVRYMSNLPSYLEKGKSFREKPLNIGVLDWRHLEKWKYNNDPMPHRTSCFSTEGSSSHSGRGQSCSSARQSMDCSSLQPHLEASPVKTYCQDKFYSGRGYSSSPACQRTYHLVPHSHYQKVYPWESHSQNVGRTALNTDKSEEISPSTPNHRITQKSVVGMDKVGRRDQSGGRLKMFDKNESVCIDGASSSKGKLRIRESELKDAMQSRIPNQDSHPDCSKEPNTVVLLLRRNPPINRGLTQLPDSSVSANLMPRECGGRKSASKMGNYKECHGSDTSSTLPSCPHYLKDDNNRRLEMKSRGNAEERKSIVVLTSPSKPPLSVDLDNRAASESTTKARHPSPIRRLSSAMGNIIRSAGSRDNSPVRRSCSKDPVTKPGFDRAAISTSSDTDKSPAGCRARSSPLRRLLDPLIKPKIPNVRESAQLLRKSSDEQLDLLKAKSLKVKSTIAIGKAAGAKDSHQNVKKGSSPLRALLQVAIKNGLPLFTFAVDNNNDILAATLRNLSSVEKNRFGWIYTFFTVREMKKKNALWLSQGSKANGQFVPNVIAQMKVSDCQAHGRIRQKGTYSDNIREFTLFSVDVGQVDQNATEFQPTDELAAIVAKLPKPAGGNPSGLPIDPSHINSQGCSLKVKGPDSSNIQDCTSHIPLNTTVILPGGVHTVPSKGSISTLTQRWRSGGACDCGGWDLGCQLRVFTNEVESQKSPTSSKTSEEFKLFSQVGPESELVLSLNPFKERIYSVEFDSSISLVQAFATSVALLDCKRPSGLYSGSNLSVEGISCRARSSVSSDPARTKHVNESPHTEAPASYVSYPPHSPVGRV